MNAERLAWPLCLAVAVLSIACRAEAQDASHAEQLYVGADFDAARAEASAVLLSRTATRADLVVALRVLVALESMTGTPEALAVQARSLAVLDHEATPAEGAPDSALEAVRLAREAPPPSISLERLGDRVIARASEVPGIATELVVRCEDASGTHGNTSSPSATASLDLVGAENARCVAELRTPSALVLAFAERGSRSAPRAATASASFDDDLPWILLGVGGGLVVVGVVVGVVFATTGSPSPHFDAPIVIGW